MPKLQYPENWSLPGSRLASMLLHACSSASRCDEFCVVCSLLFIGPCFALVHEYLLVLRIIRFSRRSHLHHHYYYSNYQPNPP